MKAAPAQAKTCPICGGVYSAPPAISRVDNETLICPDCGIREALDSIGVLPDEKERILDIIHAHYARKEE